MRILVIRHASTEENEKGLALGKKGAPLSAEGKKEARKLAKLLKKEGISEILSSPSKRALETSREIAKETGAKVRVKRALREFDFGELEGKRYEEFPKKYIRKLSPRARGRELFRTLFAPGKSLETFGEGKIQGKSCRNCHPSSNRKDLDCENIGNPSRALKGVLD